MGVKQRIRSCELVFVRALDAKRMHVHIKFNKSLAPDLVNHITLTLGGIWAVAGNPPAAILSLVAVGDMSSAQGLGPVHKDFAFLTDKFN